MKPCAVYLNAIILCCSWSKLAQRQIAADAFTLQRASGTAWTSTRNRCLFSTQATGGDDYDGELESTTFRERYGDVLPHWLLDKCTDIGWKYPTRIQQRVLDAILRDEECSDVVIQAQTGSGKSLAFLLPCLASIDPSRSSIQALIVVPTRELGLQVSRVAKRLAAGHPESKMMVMSVLQGSQNRRQRAWAWADPPHVVVGTPVELSNMIQLGGIKRYNNIRYLVVDEVDACLLNNGGKVSSSENLILSSGTPLHTLLSKHLSPTFEDGRDVDDSIVTASTVTKTARPILQQRNTIFCSATIPQIRHFLKQCVQNQWMIQSPTLICLRPGEQLLPSKIQHAYMVSTTTENKLVALRRLVRKLTAGNARRKVLVFAENHRPLEEMAKVLAKDVEGIFWNEQTAAKAEPIATHTELVSVLRYEDSLTQRATALEAFRCDTSHVAILLSTDLAARGLDVTDCTHVIHFDLPDTADTYVHRSGRTGRLGRPGQVVSIVTANQEFVLQRLTNKLQVDITCVGRQASRK